jgi:hypothetical protein
VKEMCTSARRLHGVDGITGASALLPALTPRQAIHP